MSSDSHQTEKYAMLGLLDILRNADADTQMLSIGEDLTTLGLDLNSPE